MSHHGEKIDVFNARRRSQIHHKTNCSIVACVVQKLFRSATKGDVTPAGEKFCEIDRDLFAHIGVKSED